jgi:hypothetical protein
MENLNLCIEKAVVESLEIKCKKYVSEGFRVWNYVLEKEIT